MNKQKLMAQLQAKFNKVSAKCADLNADLNAKLQDDSSSVEDMKAVREQLSNEKVRRDALESQITDLQGEIDKEEVENDNPVDQGGKGKNLTPNSAKNKLENQKKAINAFIHSKGRKTFNNASQQVTSTEAGVLIPTEIIYDPTSEINSVVDLSTLVTKIPVTSPSGKYPILKRATDRFNSVKELKENPTLAAPEFDDIDWSVDTYRGAIPLSEEAIADSEVDLTALVGQSIKEKQVNTYNALIAPVLKLFTSKSTTTDVLVDNLKHILNVDLDPAYTRAMVVTQSFFNTLDTLKDKNGRYLLNDANASIAATGAKGMVLSVPVYIVGDTVLGDKAGGQKAFVGDLKRAVLFPDRQQVTLAWDKSEIYGQYLGAAFRFGVNQADKKAGFLVTNTDSVGHG